MTPDLVRGEHADLFRTNAVIGAFTMALCDILGQNEKMRKRQPFIFACILAALMPSIFCLPEAAIAQGLKGVPPAHYFGTYEQYKQEQRQEAENTHKKNLTWRFLDNIGLIRLMPELKNEYGEALLNEAFAWQCADESVRAEHYFRKAIAVEVDVQRRAAFMHFFANFLNSELRFAEENDVLEQSITMLEQTFGKDSPRLCGEMMYLADNHWLRGSKREAASLYRRCLHNWSNEEYDFYHAIACQRLAECLEDSVSTDEAEAAYKQALGMLDEHDSGNIYLIEYAYDLAGFYLRRGNAKEAEPLLKRVATLWEKKADYDMRNVARSGLTDYLKMLNSQRRFKEAKRIAAVIKNIPQ